MRTETEFSLFHISMHKDEPHRSEATEAEGDFEAYKAEHERLEKKIERSEDLWEDRTFQIAAGGLTLTFAVFSYLKDKNELAFDWQVILIWGVFSLCILLNYVSHRVAVHTLRDAQNYLFSRREDKLPYQERALSVRYAKQDRLMKWINGITLALLVGDVIYTLIYTFLKLL